VAPSGVCILPEITRTDVLVPQKISETNLPNYYYFVVVNYMYYMSHHQQAKIIHQMLQKRDSARDGESCLKQKGSCRHAHGTESDYVRKTQDRFS